MTIVTKPNIKQASEKKAEKTLGKPLVANEVPGGEYVDHSVVEPGSEDVEAWVAKGVRRRVSTSTTVCVFITALVIMSIGIIGGVYLYRQFSHHQMTRFRGWCGVPYDHEAFHSKPFQLLGNPPLSLGSNHNQFKKNGAVLEDAEYISDLGEVTEPSTTTTTTQAPTTPPPAPMFKEEFDLDLAEETYGRIRVPAFEYGRPGEFIHDFTLNMTGIIDISSGRCFVMPMDQRHTVKPRTMFELIQRLGSGYYSKIDTEVIRETMRVVYPPVNDYQPLGRYIYHYCANYPTFMLERIEKPVLRKRSVDAQQMEEFAMVEFAGNKIVQYVIQDEHTDAE